MGARLITCWFSRAKPWLPLVNSHIDLAVSKQEVLDDSVLNSFRNSTQWRKQHPALLYGDIEFIDTPEPLLAFTRKYAGEEMLVCFNLSGQPQQVNIPLTGSVIEQLGHKLPAATLTNNSIELPAFGCFYGKTS